MNNEIVIFVTAGSMEEASKISNEIVNLKLAACANMMPAIQSIFWWQDKICNEKEILIIMKSVMRNFEEIVEKIKELHSYEVPEIIALPIVAGSKEYLNWINEETKSE